MPSPSHISESMLCVPSANLRARKNRRIFCVERSHSLAYLFLRACSEPLACLSGLFMDIRGAVSLFRCKRSLAETARGHSRARNSHLLAIVKDCHSRMCFMCPVRPVLKVRFLVPCAYENEPSHASLKRRMGKPVDTPSLCAAYILPPHDPHQPEPSYHRRGSNGCFRRKDRCSGLDETALCRISEEGNGRTSPAGKMGTTRYTGFFSAAIGKSIAPVTGFMPGFAQ